MTYARYTETDNQAPDKNMKDKQIICPICRKETAWEDNLFRPFCSARCGLIDRGKWASEDYRVAGKNQDMPGEDRGEKNQTEE